ncbi:MAG: M28 family peptidase [Verrucomicrobiota bacterium]|nr:M28 family peptidase [Verrucomicrobiota bacterium]
MPAAAINAFPRPRSLKRFLARIVCWVFLLLVLPLGVILWGCVQPLRAGSASSRRVASPDRLRKHVVTLSETYHPRSWGHTANLDLCADYISRQLEKTGARTEFQDYTAQGVVCRNVRAFFGPATGERVVVGAHYDAVAGSPGADDNASGVAGLIELAGLLAGETNLPRTIELVAYTLEEPPFFRGEEMGSFRHAQLLKREGVKVRAMIALEMIGYYRDEENSQHFPVFLMRPFYPSRGDFLAVVGNLSQSSLTRAVLSGMKGATDLPVYSINAPWFVPGIDLSDHRSYWHHGFDAVMVTDTAFYRNREYHGARDTADRLDYTRMAQAVVAVHQAVLSLARE